MKVWRLRIQVKRLKGAEAGISKSGLRPFDSSCIRKQGLLPVCTAALLCIDVDRINPLELNAQFPYR